MYFTNNIKEIINIIYKTTLKYLHTTSITTKDRVFLLKVD
jgi:hypothetical protein